MIHLRHSCKFVSPEQSWDPAVSHHPKPDLLIKEISKKRMNYHTFETVLSDGRNKLT